MNKNNTQEIIQDIKDGKMVIILDDESRENEGDLVCAAELITPEIINFMASKGKGLICLPTNIGIFARLLTNPSINRWSTDTATNLENDFDLFTNILLP